MAPPTAADPSLSLTPRQLLAQARRVRLQVRRAAAALPGGDFLSPFKGAGLAFEELRAYEPGDDIRHMDWNVTARLGHPYVRRFVEERELQVLVLADLSASLAFGAPGPTLRRAAEQIVAFLGLAAEEHRARLGLALFTNHVESYVPPARGQRHLLRVLQVMIQARPAERGTSLHNACRFACRVLRRRAVLFLISDWLAPWPESWLRRLGRRHEVVAVRLAHPRAERWPAVGPVLLEDLETGARSLVDTARLQPQPRPDWESVMGSARIDALTLSSPTAALPQFVGYLLGRGRTPGPDARIDPRAKRT
ncbi:MAG TPA: DUF58 domain-containing protein [Gemmatales bacterium]|nr:DUF58 domain-containing protein [Gemmatales bacterium]HMP60580.1 DUF58 domain-containing protein [Gemmatales bacterium]